MKKFDYPLLITIVLLTLFGLFIIYDASSVIAFQTFGDKYHYIKDQLVWEVLGLITLGFFTSFNYKRFYPLALPLLIITIVLLIAVFIPGIGIRLLGARRWINLGFTSFQPSEFAKLALAIYLSAWFSVKEKGRFMAFCLLTGMVLLLIMAQPDMGTSSIILFEAFVAYYLSGASMKHFVVLGPAAALMGFLFIKIEPYRAARLTSFLNLGKSFEGASYHVKQILIALGSGGMLGVGVGNSLQKYAYLPENVTDSIFAIIAEEVGFLGSMVLILVLLFIIYRGFLIASRTKDTFGRILAGTITAFLGIQMVVNLGAMTALFPLTGVPLPFISYGGSALLIDMAAVGILLNISKDKK